MLCAKAEVAAADATRREAKVFMMPRLDDSTVVQARLRYAELLYLRLRL